MTSVRRGKTEAQTALRWALQAEGVGAVIVGVKGSGQLRENLGALGWSLSIEDLRQLHGAGA